MLLLIAATTAFGPAVWRNGWRAGIPDSVLVTVWPLSPKVWVDCTFEDAGARPTGMLAELQRRIDKDELSNWAAAHWATRVEEQFHRNGRFRVEEVEPVVRSVREARITRNFAGDSIEAVFAALAKEIGVDVKVDWEHLEESGTPRKYPLYFSLNHSSGDEAFLQAFESRRGRHAWAMSFGCDTNSIVVGASEKSPRAAFHHNLTETAARLEDWYGPASGLTPADFHALIQDALASTVSPLSWTCMGGDNAHLVWMADHIVGMMPAQDARDLYALVDCLSRPTKAGVRVVDPAEWTESREILLRLRHTEVHISSVNPTGREIAAAVAAATGIPVDLDWSGLDREGLGDHRLPEGPMVSTAYEALDRLPLDWRPLTGRPLGGWTVWHGAVRVFRHPRDDMRNDNCIAIGVYHFGDLTQDAGNRDNASTLLRQRITETIEPGTWIDSGGEVGGIREVGPLFVITTTAKQHLLLEELLADLHVKHAQGIPLPPYGQPAPREFDPDDHRSPSGRE